VAFTNSWSWRDVDPRVILNRWHGLEFELKRALEETERSTTPVTRWTPPATPGSRK
jgi:hypothetical protein